MSGIQENEMLLNGPNSQNSVVAVDEDEEELKELRIGSRDDDDDDYSERTSSNYAYSTSSSATFTSTNTNNKPKPPIILTSIPQTSTTEETKTSITTTEEEIPPRSSISHLPALSPTIPNLLSTPLGEYAHVTETPKKKKIRKESHCERRVRRRILKANWI
jgi:hypothetical protein